MKYTVIRNYNISTYQEISAVDSQAAYDRAEADDRDRWSNHSLFDVDLDLLDVHIEDERGKECDWTATL